MKLLITDPTKHKEVLVGDVEGEVLLRRVKPEHYMRVVEGYGIQEAAFNALPAYGVQKIVLITDSGAIYGSDLQIWLDHGRVADYGHGKQRFLSLKYMEKEVRKNG